MKKCIICIDLMETLISRNDKQFSVYLSKILELKNISYGDLTTKIRQRYIEYSFGNFHSDRDYVENLILTLARDKNSDAMIAEISRHLLDNYWAIDGSKDFLSELKSLGYQLYVASNFVAAWADELLKRFTLKNYFAGEFISSDIRYRKPACEFFEYITQTLNKSAEEMYFIGNSYVNDYLGAQKIGMSSILLKKNNVTGEGLTYTEILARLDEERL